MWIDMTIYSNSDYFVIQFVNLPVEEVFQVTSVIDRDEYNALIGIEVFVYEEEKILFHTFIEQFREVTNIDVSEDGLLYISIAEYSKTKRGSGFGRSADIGVSQEGLLAFIRFPWIELGAATPVVDPRIALATISHNQGIPEL